MDMKIQVSKITRNSLHGLISNRVDKNEYISELKFRPRNPSKRRLKKNDVRVQKEGHLMQRFQSV